MRKQKKTADYYLGTLVGQIIFHLYLPTMNVDSLKSPKVINVSDEEKEEADRLQTILNETYYGYDITEEISKYGIKKATEIAHKNWINYIYKLAEKHLPEKLHCRFEKIEVENLKEFRDGLTHYLWDTDLSWYMPEDDFWVEIGNHSWFSEVILTRRIGS